MIALITFAATIGASGGFWAFLQSRATQKDAHTQLLLALARREIIFVGMSFVDRGWITSDEFDDFEKYLYIPYSTFGGNGLADKVMADVRNLPMHGRNHQPQPTVEVVEGEHRT